MTLLFTVLGLVFGHRSEACEVTPFRVVFKPGMGTHVAYYCKATEAEKKQAFEMMKEHPCIAQNLKSLQTEKKVVLSEAATDLRPIYFTKHDAEKSGPILDLRYVVEEEKQGPAITKQNGFRVIATGRKTPIAPPTITGLLPLPMFTTIEYELGEVYHFEYDCPLSGCMTTYRDLCNSDQ